MKQKRMLKTAVRYILCLFLAAYLAAFLFWRHYLAERKDVYEYLHTLYGEYIFTDEYGGLWMRSSLGCDYDTFIYQYQERTREEDIRNDLGITAEVTEVSVEKNTLRFRYLDDGRFAHVYTASGSGGVEKWISGKWYNVSWFHTVEAVHVPIEPESEKTLVLAAPSNYTSSPYCGLTQADPGRYRLILPVFTDGEGQESSFCVTAEFEIQ